jgi:hypothetical protein
MTHGSSEAVELPHHDSIKAPTVRIGHQAVKFWPRLLGSADTDVYVLSENLPAAALRVLVEFSRFATRVESGMLRAGLRLDESA